MTVCRHGELNPVRTAVVAHPDHHRWSSVHANPAPMEDPLIRPHPVLLAQDPDLQKRAQFDQTWLRRPE